MSERYDHEQWCGGEYNCGMIANSTGEYVLFEDYDKLQAQLTASQEEVEELKSWQGYENWKTTENGKLRKEVERLELFKKIACDTHPKQMLIVNNAVEIALQAPK